MIKSVSPLKEWEHLKFWSEVYFKRGLDQLEGLPAKDDRFRALELTPPSQIKIVILGQDPYPTKGHANGLAFSTYPHVTQLPRSLQNIFKEYCSDLGYNWPYSGDLVHWASRGILLLNTRLSVEEGKPNSHKDKGWELLTYEILSLLNEREDPCVFILWGKDAGSFSPRVQGSHHKIIQSAHPSPLSAHDGFFGSHPFSRAAEFLGVDKSIWKLP